MYLLRLLFPGVCVLCLSRSRRDIDLCRECESAFETNDHACSRCGEPVPGVAPPSVCGTCIATPPPWAETVAPFLYSPPLTTVVEGLKTGNGLIQARILGDLLGRRLAAHYRREQLPDAIVPMPLTRRRRRQRGYNQAELLAAVVARRLGLPCRRRNLMRKRDAPPQRSLPRAARLRNVRGAFTMRRPLGFRRVALLDDVTTTGATVRAAAEALLAGGVEEVHVWVAAKTP